jgi:hypothetical protein
MKNLLFTIITFFICLNIKAQTNVYYPFPDSNAVWNETSWYIDNIVMAYYTTPTIFFLAGDTIISTQQYKKILSSGYTNRSTYPFTNFNYFSNKYAGAIRQDSIHKKVYYSNTYFTDTLLYDFNLNIGDTLPASYVNFQNSNYVSSIDSILIGSSYRKQYHISVRGSSFSGDSNYVSIIEGIGSTFGLTYPLMPPGEAGSTLNCFSQNNVTLFINPQGNCDLTLSVKELSIPSSSFQISPNPNSSSFTIQPSNNIKQTLQIFDVNGKMVLNQSINGKTTIDATNLADGVYNLSLLSNEGIINKRLIIVR